MLIKSENAPLIFNIKYFSPGKLHFHASFSFKEPKAGHCDTAFSGRHDQIKVPNKSGHPKFKESIVYLTFMTHNKDGLKLKLVP
jgi:hypothetical protein